MNQEIEREIDIKDAFFYLLYHWRSILLAAIVGLIVLAGFKVATFEAAPADAVSDEQEAYESLIRMTPKVGSNVSTPDGRGVVQETNLLTGTMKIVLDKNPEVPKVYQRDQVHPIRDHQNRGGSNSVKQGKE